MPDSDKSENIYCICAVTIGLMGLYLSALYSYLLFHSLIEIATIAIAFTLFILVWNTRRFQENNFLAILGIGYAFIAIIDLLHTLAYKGMNVFAGFGANLPTQLWIAARSLQAVTLCAAPLFVARRVYPRLLCVLYLAVVSTLVASIFSGTFPDCFIEGKGLTPFKTGSEYAITGLLLASTCLFYRERSHFKDSVFFLILSSIVCTALSEISFTFYLSVYGPANMVGHFLKLGAFYLLYRALLVTGLKDPYEVIFRELTEAEEELKKSHDILEEKVRVRTAELRAKEEKYRALIECANDAVFIHEIGEDGMPAPFIEVNEVACRRLGYKREELTRMSPLEIDDPRYRDRIAQVMERLFSEGHALFETAQITKDGRSIPVEVSTRLLELDGTRLLFSLVRDITERKVAEESVHRLNRELQAVSNCNQVLMRAAHEGELLGDICRIICDEAGYRMAWVGYAEKDEAKTIRPVACAGVEEGYLEEAAICWGETERGRGPTGTAIKSGKSAWIEDFQSDPSAAPWRDGALRRGYRSSIALPLKDEKEDTFGALTIYSSEPNAFAAGAEVHLLEDLAGDLAFGVNALRARNARKEGERSIALLTFALDKVREDALLIDREARFRYVNEEACRELKYTREELLSLRVSDINPDFPPESWPAHWEEMKVRGSLTFEGRHRTSDGIMIPVEINANYLEYAEEGYILGLVRDITERKTAEEALHKITEELEERVKSRTAELEGKNEELARLNRLFIGRELRMVELKEKIRELEMGSRLQEEREAPDESPLR